MLKLTAEQLAQLDGLEKLQYVEEVRKNIIVDYPALANDEHLKTRLEAAYQYAISIRFTDGPAITKFLYYDALAPGFYREPAIDRWLRKPRQSVEQRFSDLLEVFKSKLRED